MPVLTPSEYDAFYFDGKNQTYTHNAGYSEYGRMQYNQKSTRYVPSLEESTGTVFGDLIKGLGIRINNRFIGKKVLVPGCAYGFEVEGFMALGVDARGIDVSPFAISKANPAVAPYLSVADARVKVPTYKKNEWDYIFSRGFLECLSDADLFALIPELNRVCRSGQLHIIGTLSPVLYYNTKTLSDWKSLPFAVGSIFIADDDLSNYVTKIN